MATNSKQDNKCFGAEGATFCARMQAQCDEIEAYRAQVKRCERRELTIDEAAQEWIARYAKSFSSRWQDQ